MANSTVMIVIQFKSIQFNSIHSNSNQSNPMQINPTNPIQINPMQINPIQINPIQLKSIQSKSNQFNPIQIKYLLSICHQFSVGNIHLCSLFQESSFHFLQLNIPLKTRIDIDAVLVVWGRHFLILTLSHPEALP